MKKDPYIVRDPSTPAKFENRHSICLFVPYFGKLPPHAPLFLKSCAWNPTIQWFIPTDADWSSFSVPGNVSLIRMTFDEMRARVEKSLGCRVSLPTPYKLCDIKPMYGLIFADLARGFDFWGHCDMDLVFGDLRAFLPGPALDNSMRLYENGHLSVFKNTPEICQAFKLEAVNADYRRALNDPVIRVFDERGVNYIFRQHNFPTFRNFLACANISPQYRDFRSNGEPRSQQPRVWVWRKGKMFREFYENGQLGREEFAYVHILRRHMALAAPDLVDTCDHWLIVPNVFIPTGEKAISPGDMLELNQPSWEHYGRWQIRRVREYFERKKYRKKMRRQYGYREKTGGELRQCHTEPEPIRAKPPAA